MKLDDMAMGAIGIAVIGAMLISLADCSPPVQPTRKSACEAGCDNIVSLGCPEGVPPCADVCERASALHFRNIDPICWLDAGSIRDLNACGVRCRP